MRNIIEDWSVNVLVIRRGDIYFADLRPVVGSEQGGIRPVLIIQNDMGNRHSPTVICAAITSKMNKGSLLTTRFWIKSTMHFASALHWKVREVLRNMSDFSTKIEKVWV